MFWDIYQITWCKMFSITNLILVCRSIFGVDHFEKTATCSRHSVVIRYFVWPWHSPTFGTYRLCKRKRSHNQLGMFEKNVKWEQPPINWCKYDFEVSSINTISLNSFPNIGLTHQTQENNDTTSQSIIVSQPGRSKSSFGYILRSPWNTLSPFWTDRGSWETVHPFTTTCKRFKFCLVHPFPGHPITPLEIGMTGPT